MRKIYAFVMVMWASLSFSQDARLFENTWYLTNVIVNGANNFPPNGTMNINFLSPNDFTAYACNTMLGSVAFDANNTTFSASNYFYTLDFCFNPPTEAYQNIYFPFFLDGNEPNPSTVYDFTYTISENQEVRTLIITSMFNQQAVYSSVMLATANFEKSDYSLAPNPATDFVEIHLNTAFTEEATAEFYNELGQICKTVNLKSAVTTIELNNLSSGIYIVKVKTQGETVTKKCVKM